MSDNRRAPISNTRGSGNGGNRNNNRQDGSHGGGGNRNRSQGNRNNRGSGGGGNRNNRGGRSLDPDRQVKRTRKKEKPLTLWQKILKALGLYKPAGAATASAKPQTKGGRDHNNNNKGPKAGGSQRPPRKRAPRKNAPSDPNKVSGNRLYVGNLSYETTEYELEELFKGVGTVRAIEVVYNRRTHKSKGYAFLEMQNTEEAKRAVEVLHDQPFMGRNMIVNGAKSKGAYDDNGNAPDENLPSSLKDETPGRRPNPAEETVTPLVASSDKN